MATRRFQQHFQNLPLAKQIRLATPVAREMITEGLDYGERRELSTGERVMEIVKDPILEKALGGAEDYAALVEDWLEAARALGIATGLMLSGSAFLGNDGAQ